ncbi:Retrovirus-related Pol polyprotein from transposon TNT 1-94 [Araneus ventricosus]|uniref:Retrovirus-related Pol polyprotein from transposon TNT 1-94 n=1 Tax=Araneus ventricosus TaxID=182803 RepID=A0A4Y2QFG8_ARAVE|nr:Retrovirus-related Pol polyprotein from transposon TNT 1-94 [Araneus ventricosus]
MEMVAKNSRKPATVLISSTSNTLQAMHERMTHENTKQCIKFVKSHGISLSNENPEFSLGCVYGKAHRKSFHSRAVRSTKSGDQINADVVGPMEEDSVGGSRFILVLKVGYTKFRRVFFLKAKSEVPNCIETFLNEAKTACHTVKQMLCDPGTEFINHSVKKILNDRGIDLRVAMVETPEQNGAAEWENSAIVEAARAMVHEKELPKKLWAEACNAATYELNHTDPTPVEDKTPYELWHGKSENFNIKRLRIFGTKCYVHEPKQIRRKWDKKSVEGLFVGYEAHDGYRVFIPSKNKVERSCKAIFCDESPYKPLIVEVTGCSVMCPVEENESTQVSDVDECREEPDPGRRYPERKHKRPQFISENYVLFVSTLTGIETPSCYSEAMRSPKSKLWEEDMFEELQSLEENGTLELTELPENQRILDNKLENSKALCTPYDVTKSQVGDPALSTPYDVTKSQVGDPVMVDVPYREAVCCLQYLAVATMPDIAFAVAFASRALCKPTKDDWQHVKRIYRYLRGTNNVGLLYKSHVQTEFSVFSDADHAGDEKTRRSTSGMVSINSCAAITFCCNFINWSRICRS